MTQLNRDDLTAMNAEQIVAAHETGQLEAILGTPAETVALLDRATSDEPLDHGDVTALAAIGRQDLIVAAHESGRIQTTTTQE